MKFAKLNISGMHCSACSGGIEHNLSKLGSIKNIKINVISGKAKIAYDETQISEEKIIELITSYGFPTSKDDSKSLELKYLKSLKIRFFVAVPLFVVIFCLHMFGFHNLSLLQLFLATIVQVYCAYPFYVGSLSFFKTKNADMNVLIALGTSVAYLYSLYLYFSGAHEYYFEGSAAVICFVLLGEYLKSRAKQKANDDLELLTKILPTTAKIKKGDNFIHKEILDIKKGDVALVISGEKVPLDGVITKGTAEIVTSHIDGEGMPKTLKVGDEVVGGSLVLSGEIEVEAQKDSQEFFVYEMLDILELSQSQKAPIGALADKIASIFVPIVVLLSVIMFVVWLILGKGLAFSLAIMASILVVSCPCALGLAVPLAIVCGISRAKKSDILIKSPEVFEKARDIKYIALDKTGTLTQGKIEVFKTEIFKNEENVLKIAKAMQEHNPHPISKAIIEYTKDAQKIILEEKEYLIGQGIKAKCQGKTYYFGAIKWLESLLGDVIVLSEDSSAIALCEETGEEKELLGIFYLQDGLKEGAQEMLKTLKSKGIIPVILSGDNKASVSKLANELGITEFFAEISPIEKSDKVALLKQKGAVCFVGDGINDALAFKEATFGISFANATELAKEVGDVLLLKEDLKGISEVFMLSYKVLGNIRQNLFFAYVYNIILIPISAGILYPFGGILLQPAFAGGAMALSSVSVVSNALRIIRAKL